MLWLVMTAGGVGILFGLRLQVASVIAASAVIALTALLMVPFSVASLMQQLGYTAALLFALQCGYLAGLVVFLTWTRGISRRGDWSIPTSQHSASEDR
jgi:hypothetical protein